MEVAVSTKPYHFLALTFKPPPCQAFPFINKYWDEKYIYPRFSQTVAPQTVCEVTPLYTGSRKLPTWVQKILFIVIAQDSNAISLVQKYGSLLAVNRPTARSFVQAFKCRIFPVPQTSSTAWKKRPYLPFSSIHIAAVQTAPGYLIPLCARGTSPAKPRNIYSVNTCTQQTFPEHSNTSNVPYLCYPYYLFSAQL